MFSRFRSTTKKHLALQKKVHHGPLASYLHTPPVDPAIDHRHAEYLAVDFETTGLNPETDAIVSIGYVPIRDSRIQLAEAHQELIVPHVPLKAESVTIHGITHEKIMQNGQPEEEAIERLLIALAGKVMLVHYARIEQGFLNKFCKQHYGHFLPVHIVDTLELERTSLDSRSVPISRNALRLGNVRERYHLPRYPAHNALGDAISTAELFFALARHKQGAATHYPLKNFLL
ncbi:MAG: exonuclease domain-containing protein [bacterium]